jgi:hypothetical protein
MEHSCDQLDRAQRFRDRALHWPALVETTHHLEKCETGNALESLLGTIILHKLRAEHVSVRHKNRVATACAARERRRPCQPTNALIDAARRQTESRCEHFDIQDRSAGGPRGAGPVEESGAGGHAYTNVHP